MARRTAALLMFAGLDFASSTRASPPPPPPGFEAGLVRQSCGEATKLDATQVPVTVRAVDPATLGVRNDKLGRLAWKWGVRISGKDPRLGRIVGLELNGDLGLLAVTANADWLTFDIRSASLAGLKSVGIASIAGAPGAPSSLTEVYHWTLVSFPDQKLVAAFALSACGMAARPAPIFTISGDPKATIATDAAYTYVGLVGQDAAGVHDALALPYAGRNQQLGKTDLPTLPGYRLQALSNPSKIVPYFIAAWRPTRGAPETLLQTVHVPAWDDVWSPDDTSKGTDLARFPRPLSAVATFYDRQTEITWVIAAAELNKPDAIELYAFTCKGRSNQQCAER